MWLVRCCTPQKGGADLKVLVTDIPKTSKELQSEEKLTYHTVTIFTISTAEKREERDGKFIITLRKDKTLNAF